MWGAALDNGDATITDQATGLMWTKGDSGAGMSWQEALAWAQTKNAENHLGHSDWRLPNTKELQGIVDYTRSPDTTSSAAIDPLFTCTGITNEAGKADYPFYWTSTTHMSQGGGPDASAIGGGYAVYIAFGRAMGYMTDPSDPSRAGWLDVHGAGAQRSDPKVGNPADFPHGHGPQGDAVRIYNFVRLVRGGDGLWSGGMSVGGGWKHLDWLGYYFTDQTSPWIYHLQHGWLYSSGQDSDSVWFFSPDVNGWLWTADGQYPWMFFWEQSTWVWYQRDSVNPRWFYDSSLQQWQSY